MKLHLKWDETPKLNLLLYNKINSTLSFLIQNVLGQNTEDIITAKNYDLSSNILRLQCCMNSDTMI